MLRILFWGITFCLYTTTSFGQDTPPPNDRCANAIPMEIGQKLTGLTNNFATTGPATESPSTRPGTCVLTLENDVWFRFTTEKGFNTYEIVITHQGCNTPAGLQALVIRTDDCNANHFDYRGCSNKQTEDTIKIFLEDSIPGLSYLIYVDGFDGTVCEYTLELKGSTQKTQTPDQLKYVRYNYDMADQPEFAPLTMQTEFINNMVEFEWVADSKDDISYFLVERFPGYEKGEILYDYTEVIGIVDATNKVAGGETHYYMRDERSHFEEDEYCYRIISVTSTGKRSYSKLIIVKGKPFYTLYVGEVKKAPEPGKFQVIYVNKKKKATYVCDVLDEKMNLVKSMTLSKEPIRDGTVTFDMNPYPAGRYYFQMSEGEHAFRREFFSEGKTD